MKRYLITSILSILFILHFVGCDASACTNNEVASSGESEPVQNTVLSKEELNSAFLSSVSENPHDKWREEKWAEGIMSPLQIGIEERELWINEMKFTIEQAEYLFDNAEAYNSWKSELEDWLEATCQACSDQTSLMSSTGELCDVILDNNELIRQKTIDVKFFCYLMEIESGITQDPACLRWNSN